MLQIQFYEIQQKGEILYLKQGCGPGSLSVLEECKAAHFTPYAVLYFVFTVAFAHVANQVNPQLISEFAEKSRDVQYISEQ